MLYKAISDFFTELNGLSESEKKEWERIIKRESLSCNRCNGLAAPVFGTVNKYECQSCQRRFTNTKHYINKKLNAYVKERTEKEYKEVLSQMS